MLLIVVIVELRWTVKPMKRDIKHGCVDCKHRDCSVAKQPCKSCERWSKWVDAAQLNDTYDPRGGGGGSGYNINGRTVICRDVCDCCNMVPTLQAWERMSEAEEVEAEA